MGSVEGIASILLLPFPFANVTFDVPIGRTSKRTLNDTFNCTSKRDIDERSLGHLMWARETRPKPSRRPVEKSESVGSYIATTDSPNANSGLQHR